jgi:hypothetical protein
MLAAREKRKEGGFASPAQAKALLGYDVIVDLARAMTGTEAFSQFQARKPQLQGQLFS